jgi:cytochrome c
MKRLPLVAIAVLWSVQAFAAEGNAARGERMFQNCMPCHSLAADKNMTGPSLSGLWGRKAGTAESFTRYSDALKSSGVVWNDQTLDKWLADPEHTIPGNTMTFRGIADAQQRADVLAYLKQATQPGNARMAQQMPQMGGMMRTSVPNLKKLDAEDRVQSVAYCRDTYEVTTADGKKHKFWERNLRLKTDSSEDGPTQGAPALVPAGMMGDRADVIFSGPDEIGPFVKSSC